MTKKVQKGQKGRRPLAVLAALAAALGSAAASAQQAGDWVFGAGWLHIAPQDSSSPLRLTAPVPATLFGSGATVGSADTVGFSVNYFLTSRWTIEGVVGVPPRLDLYGAGTLQRVGKLGDARQWSPAIVGKYYFGEPEAQLRPFLGLGVTYVRYGSVNLTPGLQGALNAQLGLPPGAATTTASLSSSFAPVFNVGASWQFDKHWGLQLSVSYIPLKTTATLSTNSTLLGLPLARSEATLKINPIVPYLAATYRF